MGTFGKHPPNAVYFFLLSLTLSSYLSVMYNYQVRDNVAFKVYTQNGILWAWNQYSFDISLPIHTPIWSSSFSKSTVLNKVGGHRSNSWPTCVKQQQTSTAEVLYLTAASAWATCVESELKRHTSAKRRIRETLPPRERGKQPRTQSPLQHYPTLSSILTCGMMTCGMTNLEIEWSLCSALM